jgi:hypothetical protein
MVPPTPTPGLPAVMQHCVKGLEAAGLTMMQDAVVASPGPVVWGLSRFVTQADVSDENRAMARRLRTSLSGGPTPPDAPEPGGEADGAGPQPWSPLWGHRSATEGAGPRMGGV